MSGQGERTAPKSTQQKGTAVRNTEERELAARCLELATSRAHGNPVREAARYLDFVLGIDRAESVEKVKAAVDALR